MTMTTNLRFSLIAAVVVLGLMTMAPARSWAQSELPDGPGRAELEKLCKTCHELARSISKRQDRDGWNQTMTKMVAFGMRVSDTEHSAVVDYLVKYYPAEEVPPVNVNTAPAIELESRLSLRRSHAAAFVAHRKKVGAFKSLADLKAIPGVDFSKFEAKKDRLVF